MSNKKLTIDDLLGALKNPNSIDESLKADVKRGLENTAETWARIGNRDVTLADDIGIDRSELNDFLKEWTEDNPYNNI